MSYKTWDAAKAVLRGNTEKKEGLKPVICFYLKKFPKKNKISPNQVKE